MKIGLLLGVGLGVISATVTTAQERPARAIQVSAFPALDYNSDDGFGYGVVGGVYAYGGGDRRIYQWSLEPSLFFTTGGRRVVTVLFDAPSWGAGAVRVTAFAGWERDCCYPYYGLGNGTGYDPALASPASGPNHYGYRRERLSLVGNLQWTARPGLRVLAGMAAYRNEASSGGPTTLFAADSAAGRIPVADLVAWSIGPRFGVVVDTRDAERDPTQGIWLEGLVWYGAPFLGSRRSFGRYSATARGYFPLARRATVAGRVMGEHVRGAMPLTMLPDMGSSFRDFLGVGGAKSVRGVYKARYLGQSRVIANLELRLRGNAFRAAGQRWRPGVVAFVDAGRVWAAGVPEGGSGLHWGRGFGARLTWGDAFIVAVDLGRGSEAGTQTYVGLGHLF